MPKSAVFARRRPHSLTVSGQPLIYLGMTVLPKSSASHVSANRRATTGLPSWVKGFGILFILLLVIFVLMHVLGGGFAGHLGQ
jgi:hypothetical protein